MGQRTDKGRRKSVAVIGEGITEQRYIDGLRVAERYRFHLAPGLPKHSDIGDMVRLCEKKIREGYDYVVCLVDMDVILSSGEKTRQYERIRREHPQIIFVESNACIEYWFLLHFMNAVSSREFSTYESVVRELRKHVPNYDKTERFFNSVNMYEFLKRHGDMDRALELSRELDLLRRTRRDEYKSYSQMYRLFDIIRKCR